MIPSRQYASAMPAGGRAIGSPSSLRGHSTSAVIVRAGICQ
jgi:hypothetical protein